MAFNPAGLRSQPLFHCENLGSAIFRDWNSPTPWSANVPHFGHSLSSLQPFEIPPSPSHSSVYHSASTVSEPWSLKSMPGSPPLRVILGVANCWFAFSASVCDHSAFPGSVSLVISCQPPPPVLSLPVSFLVSPVLFSHSLHPWCENHRGLYRLVNTALKKAVWREQQGLWGGGVGGSKDWKRWGKVKKMKKAGSRQLQIAKEQAWEGIDERL